MADSHLTMNGITRIESERRNLVKGEGEGDGILAW